MVQAKKSKAKKQPKAKKIEKSTDMDEFRVQLDSLGLKIVEVTADGNCFFRALADQLEGDQEEHMKYRLMVVQYIMKNRGDFEPFIEDEVPFDEYCKSMEQDSTWAGNMELQAASLVTHCNMCIHRIMSPRWYIQNFQKDETRMVHLSYHDGEHYNSIRLKDDYGIGPAKLINIKADANLSAASCQEKTIKSGVGTCKRSVDEVAVKKVMSGTGCHSAKKVKEVLQEFDGDIEAAIQYLTLEDATEECSNEDDALNKMSIDEHENRNSEEPERSYQSELSESQKNNVGCDLQIHSKNIEPIEMKIARNKVCPCGSKKKYKACCGSGAWRPSTNFVIPQEVHFGKCKKGKKQGRKRVEPIKIPPHGECRGGQIDMGALCI